jgi:hypothetical protein
MLGRRGGVQGRVFGLENLFLSFVFKYEIGWRIFGQEDVSSTLENLS